MKRPTPASQKKVTVENLVGLGAERLAEILVGVAETRVDLKRRLRMELAAEQGPAALAAEIDKRLSALETSRGQISWRARPAFIRDLDALRDLIVERLAPVDTSAASDRLWRFMDAARQSERRYRQRNDQLERVYARAAAGLGRLLAAAPTGVAATALVESVTKNPAGWKAWLPALLAQATPALAEDALRFMGERRGAVPGCISLLREMADAAGDVDAFIATYPAEAMSTPSVAADIGRRLLAVGRTQDAGEALQKAAPSANARRTAPIDFEWESVWIAFLDAGGRKEEAQAARWASFERTLSASRLRDFLGPLTDFEDVEAEHKAFALAAESTDFEPGLRFLMEWPALAEASRMIECRRDEAQAEPEAAEEWAAKLRRRYPRAAHDLLRRAAAAAFRRRDYKTCDRLSAEAETITIA